MSTALVREELWRIFTFYTLHGNDTPLWCSCFFPFTAALHSGDPGHLRCSQLVWLLSDCGLVARGGSHLLEADIACAFQAELMPRAPRDNNTPDAPLRMAAVGGGALARARVDRPRRIDFAAFLSLLCKLSVKAFRREARSSSEAFEMMLRTKVLPLASRRFPEDVAGFMADPQVAALFVDNQDEIKRAFDHHAPHGSLAYADFLRLAGASDLTPALLTAAELGDAFLSSTASVCALGALSYAEFLQALVRCALMAYSKVSDSTILHKLSSLLLHMRDARARRRL